MIRAKLGPPAGATPRGPCATCRQGFSPATDAQWRHRWQYHVLLSQRHKKSVQLSAQGGPVQENVKHA